MFATNRKSRRQPRRLTIEGLEGRQLMVANLMDAMSPAAPAGLPNSELAAVARDNAAAGQDTASMYIMNPIANISEGTFPTVGEVNKSTAPGSHWCTGTLIDPQHVLTAAHCTAEMANNGAVFVAGGKIYPSTQVFTHPAYNKSLFGTDAANDIAVVRLAQPVSGVTPTPVGRTAPQPGTWVALVGYGNTGTGQTGEIIGTDGVKRYGFTPIERVTQSLIHWTFDSAGESSTMHGDSGGPALAYVNGQYVVAGVTSGGYPAPGTSVHGTYGATAYDTRVDVYANWVDGIVDQANQQSVATPQLIGPAGTATTTQPTLRWNPVGNAARYHLYVYDVTAGQVVINNASVTQASYTPNLVNGHSYRFWVAAISANGTRSQWSTNLDFTVQQPVATSAPTVLSPSGTQYTRRPSFSWTAVPGAARYHVYVTDLTTGQNGVVSGQVSGTSASLNFSLASGHNYRVWVAAVNPNGSYGQWSSPRDFAISLYAYAQRQEGENQPNLEVEVLSKATSPILVALPERALRKRAVSSGDRSSAIGTSLRARRPHVVDAIDEVVLDAALLRRLRGRG